ncbi:hypothetical protein M407DRAFT_21693 [Tulasnella calospora MUT 4182]|uniref:Rho termination factor N-terminal domain-containing protein n=1 Tax=Tulasnella calospora MUT 4182 TaxID=1051891 RepID=A0A0C3QDL8_9AGAM|nr:hypothetical protein M407DRAFT_21693 [Tulasnella calospora MUT 4182]
MNAAEDFSKEKVDVLKRMCRERGLNGYSKLKKSELVDLLNNSAVARGSASTCPSQPATAYANSPRIGSSLPPRHSLHTIDGRHGYSNASSLAPSAASPAIQQPSKLGYPTNLNHVVQSAPSAHSAQEQHVSNGQGGASPAQLSEPQALIATSAQNLILGCEGRSNPPPLTLSGHPNEHDDTAHGFSTRQPADSNPIVCSTPLISKSSRARSGQSLPVVEPRSTEHGEPKAKRQKVLPKGKGKEVSAEQELVDCQLMPPPQLTQLPRPGPEPVSLCTGTHPTARFTLSESHQRQGDELAGGGLPPPSISIVKFAHHALIGSSLPLQSAHTPISGHVRSSNYAKPALTTIKPLVFQEPKQLVLDGKSRRKEVQNQSIPYASFDSIVCNPEAVHITRESYENSFLSQFFSSSLVGFSPLADHLWSSADHPLQAAVALRFVLSRLFFALGCGMVRQWSMNQVFDARPFGKSQEVWKIEVQDTKTRLPNRATFYILSSTGEVIGRPLESGSPEAGLQAVVELPIRGDWSSFINTHRLEDAAKDPPSSLFSFVRWQNAEEYDHGISKAWLKRLASDPDALSKIQVAKRYIMANVVPNSVSGRYMTPIQMAQDLNGCLDPQERFPSIVCFRGKQGVNMFLAM